MKRINNYLHSDPIILVTDETTAARRRFIFFCAGPDGITPITGQTFSGSQLRVGFNFSEQNFQGTVGEIGGGFYYYEPTAAEIAVSGSLSVRPSVFNVMGSKEGVSIVGVEPVADNPLPTVSTAFNTGLSIGLHIGIG